MTEDESTNYTNYTDLRHSKNTDGVEARRRKQQDE